MINYKFKCYVEQLAEESDLISDHILQELILSKPNLVPRLSTLVKSEASLVWSRSQALHTKERGNTGNEIEQYYSFSNLT